MGEYDRQIETAKRLIAKKGQAVIWRSNSNVAPSDPSKPWLPSDETSADNNTSIVFLPPSRENQELLRYLKGTEVPTGSLSGLMGAVDFEVSLKAVVVRNGEQLTISNIDTLAPNGDPILYFLEFST